MMSGLGISFYKEGNLEWATPPLNYLDLGVCYKKEGSDQYDFYISLIKEVVVWKIY